MLTSSREAGRCHGPHVGAQGRSSGRDHKVVRGSLEPRRIGPSESGDHGPGGTRHGTTPEPKTLGLCTSATWRAGGSGSGSGERRKRREEEEVLRAPVQSGTTGTSAGDAAAPRATCEKRSVALSREAPRIAPRWRHGVELTLTWRKVRTIGSRDGGECVEERWSWWWRPHGVAVARVAAAGGPKSGDV